MLSPGGTRTMELEPEPAEPETQPESAGSAKRARSEGDGDAATAAPDADGSAAMDGVDDDEEGNFELPPQDPELPTNRTGNYELCAILTHKGPSADGGHYVAY